MRHSLLFDTFAFKADRSSLRRIILGAGLAAGLAMIAGPSRAHFTRDDFPTVAIADYVFGCMATNGQTREALEKCSCSIDVISSILSYDDYVEAETVARMRLLAGEKAALFRTTARSKEAIATLKRAQAEAEIRCF